MVFLSISLSNNFLAPEKSYRASAQGPVFWTEEALDIQNALSVIGAAREVRYARARGMSIRKRNLSLAPSLFFFFSPFLFCGDGWGRVFRRLRLPTSVFAPSLFIFFLALAERLFLQKQKIKNNKNKKAFPLFPFFRNVRAPPNTSAISTPLARGTGAPRPRALREPAFS